MFEIIDSKDIDINGYVYDFTGCSAELSCSGKIISVVNITTGEDLTIEFKKKYGQD